MAVAVHHGRDLWNFAREDTDPIQPTHLPRPEGPWGPWALNGLQCQQQRPIQNVPLQNPTSFQNAAQHAAAQKSAIQTSNPTPLEAVVLWERPPKPAGWSAIWEVLPPPPPPPFGQDGVWIWVPEGEEAPVGGMIPHEGAFLPCADIDDDDDVPAEGSVHAASENPLHVQGFMPSGFSSTQAPFAQMPLGAAPSEYSSGGGTSVAGQEIMLTGQVPFQVSEQTAVSRKSEFPSGCADSLHSQIPFPSGMSAMHSGLSGVGIGNAKDAFTSIASAATPRMKDASSMTSAPFGESNPSLTLPGVVQAPRDSPPSSQAQVWNPFPTETISADVADPPVEQAWNPWASVGEADGPFSRSLQETQRMIVGDIGAFNSDDWRSRSALPSMQSVSGPSTHSLHAAPQAAGNIPSMRGFPSPCASMSPPMPMPFGSGCAAQLAPIGMEDFQSLESTSFWQVQPAPGPALAPVPVQQSGSFQVPTPRSNSMAVRNQVQQLGISSQGSIPPGRKSIPSAGSGSQAFLTSTSDGLEVTYPLHQMPPPSSHRFNGHGSGHGAPPSFVPGAAQQSLSPKGTSSPTPWPMPGRAGLRPTPQVQLLDVTGADSNYRMQMDLPGTPDYDVLGPMHPAGAQSASYGANATWMNDPRLAQMPVAQVAERNRHAAPVLLDVTSGGQSFYPDD